MHAASECVHANKVSWFMVPASGPFAFIVTLAASLAPGAHAAWPEKPVRMVVPYATGASADVSARQLIPKMSELLGQQVFAENRGGASGILGTELVKKSAADGYTIMYATAQTHAINKGLFAKLPYDPVADFSAIGRIATLKFVLVVPPELPVRNAGELATYIKTNPGKVNFASSGNGTTAHLAGVYMNKVLGTSMTHVPYNSMAQAIADLSANRVTMLIYPYAPVRGAVQSGKLKLLASTGTTRSVGLTDVPTMIESGFPGFVVTTWNGIYAPARTPRPVVDLLNDVIARTIRDPGVLKSLEAGGYAPDPTTPEEFAEFTRTEAARYAEILKNSGVTVD
jgi:tripartite-type tricarboxylate transporter receptor subunit TctC